jgi:hypothetical protein
VWTSDLYNPEGHNIPSFPTPVTVYFLGPWATWEDLRLCVHGQCQSGPLRYVLEFTQPFHYPEDSGKPGATKEGTHGIHHTEPTPPAVHEQEPHVIDSTVPTAITVPLGTLGAMKLTCPQGSRRPRWSHTSPMGQTQVTV